MWGPNPQSGGILEAILNQEQGVGFEPLTMASRRISQPSYQNMAARVGGGKREVRGNELLEDSLLVGGSTGKVVKGIVDGVKEARVEGGGLG
jgi:hypothetical protein